MTYVPPTDAPRTGTQRVPQLAAFRERCEALAGRPLTDPAELHSFSLERAPLFWRALLDWSELPWSGSADTVLTTEDVQTARFFPDVRLNHAEALLRPLPDVPDDRPALTAVHADGGADRFSRGELRAAVQRTAAALAAQGAGVGERVVAIAPNTAEVLVAALGATALGATVSTATPDMGAGALLGRFQQAEPVLMVVDRTGMDPATLTALVDGLPSLRAVLLLDAAPLPGGVSVAVHRLADLVSAAGLADAVDWPRLPFDHPLFVMFSSGTTGPPKAMVHGAGGTLLEHVKEHRLHGDLRPGDTLYFHTTTAWMMWNWQLSALAVGAHVVLYDGLVAGPATLWELVADHGVTVLGTSPAYLQLCQDEGYRPRDAVDLSRLRAVLSTGAVLHDWQFDWLAEAVGDVPLQSISGGTDIIGCFLLGHPELPVRRGRCQSRSLGLDVAAVDAGGRELIARAGDLVCRRPFPSRPIGFLQDPDGGRFHRAYFAEHPGAWTHGDVVEIDADGSARVHGRSDGVLNVNGIRIGPSEIYTALHGVPAVAEAMAVEQRDPERTGATRMVLLVVLAAGAQLDGDLQREIRRTLRHRASAAHVPALVVAVPELPLTHNGKRSERAARDAVNGDPVGNVDALRNPASLEGIRAALVGTTPAAVADGAASTIVDRGATVERIWRETLRLPAAVHPDHDFTDLGGSSREAMTLLRRIALEMGADVPVQEFSSRPTLRALVEAVNTAAAVTPDAVLLRAGTGRPLFFLGDAWGQVNSYATLAQRLDTDRPVYGLRLRLTAEDGRRCSIEETARHALPALRAVQPVGPYSLAGYSFGGLVAYELARAVTADGGDVSYLGLLDVLPPIAAMTRVEAGARRLGRLLDLGPGALLRAAVDLVRSCTRPVAARTEEDVFAASWSVSNAYVPGRHDGPVTYFQAMDRPPLVGNLLSVWRRVASHLFVTEVPGCHNDPSGRRLGVLSTEVADDLAARVSASLR